MDLKWAFRKALPLQMVEEFPGCPLMREAADLMHSSMRFEVLISFSGIWPSCLVSHSILFLDLLPGQLQHLSVDVLFCQHPQH